MKNIFNLNINNIFIFSFYLICIFGILFLNWDIFLILYIFWAEFLILSIFKIIIFIFNTFSNFLKDFKFADLIYVFLEILFYSIGLFFIVFFYGFMITLLFRGEDIPKYNHGKDILLFFIDYIIKHIYIVWLPILLFGLKNLYILISDTKIFLKNLEKEYVFRVFMNHFFLLFIAIIVIAISELFDLFFLGRKIAVILFILLLFLVDISKNIAKNNINKNQN